MTIATNVHNRSIDLPMTARRTVSRDLKAQQPLNLREVDAVLTMLELSTGRVEKKKARRPSQRSKRDPCTVTMTLPIQIRRRLVFDVDIADRWVRTGSTKA